MWTIKLKRKCTKANNESIRKLHTELRNILIDKFGMCSRGPIIYDILCVIYGKRTTKRYWKWIWEENEKNNL